MHYNNFLKVHKNASEKMLAEYFCGCLFCKNNNTINCDDKNGAIETEDELCKLCRPCKNSRCFQKTVQIVQYYANHIAHMIIDQHFAEKSIQVTIRDYFQSL